MEDYFLVGEIYSTFLARYLLRKRRAGMKTLIQSGFTLIETLVAFAVLSVGLSVLYFSFSDSLALGDRGAMSRRSAVLLEQVQERLGTDIPLVRGEQTGNFDAGGHWRVTIERAENAETVRQSASDLFQVHVEVIASEGVLPVSIVTLRVGPKWD